MSFVEDIKDWVFYRPVKTIDELAPLQVGTKLIFQAKEGYRNQWGSEKRRTRITGAERMGEEPVGIFVHPSFPGLQGQMNELWQNRLDNMWTVSAPRLALRRARKQHST